MGNSSFPLSLVIKAVDAATAPIRQVTSKLEGVGKVSASLGKTLSMGVTAPLVGIGAAGLAAFTSFEAGMANVSTLVDTNVESMAAMEAGVIAVTRAVKVQPLGQMAEALGSIRGAGIDAASQFKVLEGSGKLAAAALGTTAEAADIATSAINAWGLKGAEAGQVYNQVFQAVNTGKMTLSQLAQGFGGVAGTVASAGVKLDEYLASVAALTTTGLPAAEAHTQLKAVIAGLTGQTKEAAVVFQRLKVKGIKELIATSGGLVPALERIRGVVKGNDTVLLKALGGAEAFNAVIGLTGNQASAFQTALGTMRSGIDGLGVAFEKQSTTTAASLQGLKNDLEIVAISIGRAVVPVVQQLVPLVERAAAGWMSLGAETQKSIVVFGGVAAALGPALTVLGNLVTVVKAAHAAVLFSVGWGKYFWMMRASIIAGLVPSLTAASASVWAFTTALMANPITWVVIAVVALAAAAYLVYKKWDPISAWFKSLWDDIWGVIGPTVTKIWNVLKWLTPYDVIVNNWEPLKAFFSQLWNGIVSVFESAWAKIEPITSKLATAFKYTPLGIAMTSFDASRRMAFGSADAAPALGAAGALPAAAGPGGEARVTVDFANLPPGVRVMPAPGNDVPLDLNLGFAMTTP